jgi:hypothetical protein
MGARPLVTHLEHLGSKGQFYFHCAITFESNSRENPHGLTQLFPPVFMPHFGVCHSCVRHALSTLQVLSRVRIVSSESCVHDK